MTESLIDLSDEQLWERTLGLRKTERTTLAELLRHLIEIDRRGLALSRGKPSLFAYCTSTLGYSEQGAFRRIYACKIAGDFPIVLNLIQSGAIHLTAVTILGPVLTRENHARLLMEAAGKTKRELQFMAAAQAPKPDEPDSVRPIANPQTDMFAGFSTGVAPPSPWSQMAGFDAVQPLSATRVRFAFTGDKTLLDFIDRAKQLLKHKFPEGKLEHIFADALDALLDKKDPDRRLKRLAQASRRPADPGDCDPLSRRIPQAVRDAVWRRDGGQCAHVDPASGERCPERGGLEFDHIVPHALGGASNNAKNIRLLCRGHNRAAAIGIFGEAVTKHWTRPSS